VLHLVHVIHQDIASLVDLIQVKWTIAPNPTNGNFTVNTSIDASYNLSIFNMTGQEIVRTLVDGGDFKGNTNSLSMAPGVYVIEISTNGITDRKRLVVQ